MQPKKLGGADFWSGLAFAALAGYIIFRASGWEYLGPDGPGPGFFPLWYGVAMAALSLCLVLSSALRGAGDAVDWHGAGRAFAVWLALAACVAALKLVGFLASFAVLTFFVVAVMYRRPLKTAAAVALASAAGFYLVFQLALGVSLP
jgi:putative tricarboxylic transport membrane protein